ncbi:hypothetical protein C0992_010534 [Termitomyces sp. T32_za158]|nr:hypothetical protein C0992_010534 [Termitomyces sp. T32_za158]
MSFQNFRLGEISLHQPLPPHLAHTQGAPASSTSTFSATLSPATSFSNPPKPAGHAKQPYGSGDSEDGYTLVFPDLAAFHEWRAQEEERHVVEFVKGDTHGSKAVPPRFKDHTKLVCARHSRSGRKKYVKKHPERVRKVPSRKLEGTGCPASISYKTYFDTAEVRACYCSKHSHEIGPANLPFTRKGRKAAQAAAKESQRESVSPNASTTPAPTTSPTTTVVEPSSSSAPQQQPANNVFSSVQMIAPLPGQPQSLYAPPQPMPYPPPPQFVPPPVHPGISQDRWENMATLFQSVREHARVYEYPSVSVAALETVLIRLYLESPIPLGAQPSMATIIQNNGAPRLPPQIQSTSARGSVSEGNSSDGTNSEDSS